MILDNDTDNKLRALHHVLVRARTQAYCGMDSKTLARLLDDTEYLATRIFAPDEDDPNEFRVLLQEMEIKHDGLKGINEAYHEAEAKSAAGLSVAAK